MNEYRSNEPQPEIGAPHEARAEYTQHLYTTRNVAENPVPISRASIAQEAMPPIYPSNEESPVRAQSGLSPARPMAVGGAKTNPGAAQPESVLFDVDRPILTQSTVGNSYARYQQEQVLTSESLVEEENRFARPIRPVYPEYAVQPEEVAADPYGQANYYQVQQPAWAGNTERTGALSARYPAYRIEEEESFSLEEGPKRKKHMGWWVLAAGIVLVAAVALIYVNRDTVMARVNELLGRQQEQPFLQTQGAIPSTQLQGYDAAPAVMVSAKAQTEIAAVCGTLPLESAAVTQTNVIGRVPMGEGLYDYYLFAAGSGALLGYYEGLPENGFMVLPNDTFYVAQPPYLLDSKGAPLVDASAYEQYTGPNPVIGPMQNGWAIISDAAGQTMNYMNAKGELLSRLWFCRAFPFTGEMTVAYMDTGNLAKPEERYVLYVLSSDGSSEIWRNGATTDDITGSACGLVGFGNGDVYALKERALPLCTSDDVTLYVDCGAMIVKDRQSGKYALYVNGEQHYDYAYDRIAPVKCDIRWAQSGQPGFVTYAVTNAAYPQPLSHYFRLEKEDGEEMVALSTASVYPVGLQ